MLLVVVDEAGIRRGRDDAVEAGAEFELARVAVHHFGFSPPRPRARELMDSLQRVERVPAQEPPGLADRPARPLVLVTPVLGTLRGTREVEVEVGRPPRGARRAGKHHPQHIGVLVVVDEPAEEEQLGRGPRREPVANVLRHVAARPLALEPQLVVLQIGRLVHVEIDVDRIERYDRGQ